MEDFTSSSATVDGKIVKPSTTVDRDFTKPSATADKNFVRPFATADRELHETFRLFTLKQKFPNFKFFTVFRFFHWYDLAKFSQFIGSLLFCWIEKVILPSFTAYSWPIEAHCCNSEL